LKVIVLAGGLSPERDVSLSSGALIANALVDNGHSVALVDLYRGVNDISRFEYLQTPGFHYEIPESEPDIEKLIAENGGRREEIGENVLRLCSGCDMVFIALHGGIGEDGRLAAVLDCKGIKYTGSSYIGCLLAMDKDLSKHLVSKAGVDTADWITFTNSPDCIDRITEEIGFPCVIKPLSCGSSIGISIVENRSELDSALGYASSYENRILAEKFIPGREFSVGILHGKALPPIEIRPKNGFYDYKNKYQGGLTEEICPANLDADQISSLQSAAETVHRTLRLGTYSRIDFILNESNGRFVMLEANALPGMTPMSLLPQMAYAAGISYRELCEIIVTSPAV